MTTVVGILNKKGVAIAADSAVTRNRRKRDSKCTKNGNKMIRLCEAVPISVMLTGNNEFLDVPWEIIIRQYRTRRGKEKHPTVKAAAEDFMRFVADNATFWTESGPVRSNIVRIVGNIFRKAVDEMMTDQNERKADGCLRRPAAFVKAFTKNCKELQRNAKEYGCCPQFEDYTLDEFCKTASAIVDGYLSRYSFEDKPELEKEKAYPQAVLDALKPIVMETAKVLIGTRNTCPESAILVFTGYGSEQEYPSLVAAAVCEGIDRRVSYNIQKQDVIEISDKRPVAICPYAQDDVIEALLNGVGKEWKARTDSEFKRSLSIRFHSTDEVPGYKLNRYAASLATDDLKSDFKRSTANLIRKNRREWEKALDQYDLRSMAELAECLVDLTGFQRILTFEQEGVGGPVDLAVISKSDGFQWLSRKSWYLRHNGNRYGNFGI